MRRHHQENMDIWGRHWVEKQEGIPGNESTQSGLAMICAAPEGLRTPQSPPQLPGNRYHASARIFECCMHVSTQLKNATAPLFR